MGFKAHKVASIEINKHKLNKFNCSLKVYRCLSFIYVNKQSCNSHV